MIFKKCLKYISTNPECVNGINVNLNLQKFFDVLWDSNQTNLCIITRSCLEASTLDFVTGRKTFDALTKLI